jgi:cell wall-associated NlpC family hydrolase
MTAAATSSSICCPQPRLPGLGRGEDAAVRLAAGTLVAVVLVIRFAVAHLGTSYYFGGTCTGAHGPDLALHCDCSSSVQQACKAGGITLPHTGSSRFAWHTRCTR